MMAGRSRCADDFDFIRDRLKQLTAVPEVKRTAPGNVGMHCSHCPTNHDIHCSLSCIEEGKKAGVAAE